ncbi:hypothetical protein K8I28_12565 [bacterium]|nr:hypothetical protein [bacterium]
MNLNQETYKLSGANNVGMIALVIGVVGLVLCGVGYAVDHARFFHAWLTAFLFWTTIGIGGLFMVLLHHVSNSVWSVVVRRIGETMMATLPYMFIFAIPVLLGIHDLYHWSHADAVAHDELLQWKQPFLNTPFFVIRTVIFFAAWALLGWWLYGLSIKQDKEGHSFALLKKFKTISAPGLILYAVTVCLAGFDWIMSIYPHWYSTIFGIYFFAGSIMSNMAFMAILVSMLNKRGVLKKEINSDRYHDIGKLVFAYMILWGYMAFSQYFLIWYANIPEETIFYMNRWGGSWSVASMILVFGHFTIPFVMLMGRTTKRSASTLGFFAVWLLVMHYVDLYWLVMPNIQPDSAMPSWMDFAAMMAIGGLVMWLFWRRFTANAIVPLRDPRLQKSIDLVSP